MLLLQIFGIVRVRQTVDPALYAELAGSVTKSAPAVQSKYSSHDRLRRSLLLTFVFGYTASSMPRALAASTDTVAYTDFLTVSKFLAGQASLDPSLAARLFAALSQHESGFGQQVQTLRNVIDDRRIDPMQLQTILDNEKSPVSALPRKIATAWVLGIVGEGEDARCVAFEDNLTNVVVKDKLAPPSYCFGAYGSWAQKPI